MTSEIDVEFCALSVKNICSLKAIRRKYSRLMRKAPLELMLEAARELFHNYRCRWFSYERALYPKETFQRLDEEEIKAFGGGIADPTSVDYFARMLSGPAWIGDRSPMG
jgi:hypothetical protein